MSTKRTVFDARVGKRIPERRVPAQDERDWMHGLTSGDREWLRKAGIDKFEQLQEVAEHFGLRLALYRNLGGLTGPSPARLHRFLEEKLKTKPSADAFEYLHGG